MDPTADYPHGYVRFTNCENHRSTSTGKPAQGPHTHIPINPDGTYPVPKGWNP